MKRSFVALIGLIFCLASTGFAQVSGSSPKSDKIKANVKKYLANNKKVIVTTDLGTRIKGNIVSTDDNDFAIKESKTGTEYVYQYDKIDRVNKSGGLSTASIITIAALGTGAAILGSFLIRRCRNEGGCL